jgi:pimeloyl-ACP methyl ester carboxylesterase
MKQGAENVIFLPGWMMTADSSAVTALGQSFAEKSHGKSYVISSITESDLGREDVLLREAEAISKFIEERDLTDVTIAGHSQGGDKAIDLVSIIQNNPGVHIQGLILLDSMGLYEQAPRSLAKEFIKDALANTPMTMIKQAISNPEVVERGLAAGNAVAHGILKKISVFGIDSLKRMEEDVQSMAKINPRLAEIQVPVIIIYGTKDPISDPNKIMPPGEKEKIINEWKDKDEKTGISSHIDPREKFLQKNVFPKSPYVRMVTPEKLGHHGLPLIRAESVANCSLYFLKRFQKRTDKNKKEIEDRPIKQ